MILDVTAETVDSAELSSPTTVKAEDTPKPVRKPKIAATWLDFRQNRKKSPRKRPAAALENHIPPIGRFCP
jgi:hypothetical protein